MSDLGTVFSPVILEGEDTLTDEENFGERFWHIRECIRMEHANDNMHYLNLDSLLCNNQSIRVMRLPIAQVINGQSRLALVGGIANPRVLIGSHPVPVSLVVGNSMDEELKRIRS